MKDIILDFKAKNEFLKLIINGLYETNSFKFRKYNFNNFKADFLLTYINESNNNSLFLFLWGTNLVNYYINWLKNKNNYEEFKNIYWFKIVK